MISTVLSVKRLIKFQNFNFSLFNIFGLIVFGGVFILILLFVYLFQLNMSIAEKNLLQKTQEEINKIIEVNRDFEVQLTKNAYLESENINLIIQKLGLEKSDKIIYIQTIDSVVARNQ
jgi:predicted RND superfamily exporter protein